MLACSQMSPSTNAQPPDVALKRRWRILYAEDVRELREVARMALTRDGHSFESAVDGRAALDRVLAAPGAFDLIITDHHMPNMNGLEFVEHLRAMNYPGKIVVFSSELKQTIHEAYAAFKVDRILPKPIFPSELRVVLAELAE
jgi:two-component system, chemotaxis family, chemotaxis protein CheY